MIQLIGIMIGVYSITRMIDLMVARNGQWFVQVCAIGTLIITFFCLVGLILSGASA